MKLPIDKRRELEKKGKRESEPTEGGGALGRLQQFEKERGFKETDIEDRSDEVSGCEESEEARETGENR